MGSRSGAPSLEARVRAALEQSGIVRGKSLVLAVSGGPDSLTLLHVLHHLREQMRLKLHVAHLDHGLRGEASAADAQAVADWCRDLDIGFTLEKADVRSAQAQQRRSPEDAAREVRYGFLAAVAAKRRADAVALGHTADDQAETVMMRILRGSGLAGLRGMQTWSRRTTNGGEIALVRPLLAVSRAETLDYCRRSGLAPRLDESNQTLEPLRNRVRLHLLPIMEQFNPAVKDALVRLSQSAAQDMAYLEREVDAVWSRVARTGGPGVAVDKAAFATLDPSIQSHLLRRAVQTVSGPEDLERYHVETMAQMMAGPTGKSLDLPGGVRFTMGYAEGTLGRPDDNGCPLPVLDGEYRLEVPGESLLSGWRVTARLLETGVEPEAPNATAHRAMLDQSAMDGPLRVRLRRPGDRFQPLGMSRPKKLQDFMVDAKVPRRWRDRVPLVTSPRGIAWVVGWRIAEWARVSNRDAPPLELRFELFPKS